jgi:hypothetical protein
MEHMILPRRSHYGRALLKWVLHVIVKGFVFIRHGFKYHTVPALIVTMVVAGSVFYLTDETMSLPFLGARGGPTYYPDGRPIAAEQYLLAKREGNAEKMWATYNDTFKQILQQNGRSVMSDQNQMNFDMQQGRIYEDFKYVAGTPLDGGGTTHLYVVALNLGTQTVELPMTFIIDPEGRISWVG